MLQQSMHDYERLATEQARIIRYEPLGHDLLSTYDRVNNILRIDKAKADLLSEAMQKRLVFTEMPRTVLVKGKHEYVFVRG